MKKEDMTPQGYANWEQCFIGHYIIAGEVLVSVLIGNESLG